MSDIAGFWDSVYSNKAYSRQLELPIVQAAERHFGELRGRTVLEFGCGPGTSAIYFASKGADVIGVDISRKAIDDLNSFCDRNNITNVRGICSGVLDLSQIPAVDFVFGSMILHHIEPFDAFAVELRRILKPGGKAFFYENSAASRVLVWFRQNVIGRWWVPKFGDPDEFPLTPQEIDKLRERFRLEIQYPEMLFFSLISTYILRGAFGRPFASLDRLFYRKRWLLRYSYRQFILISG